MPPNLVIANCQNGAHSLLALVPVALALLHVHVLYCSQVFMVDNSVAQHQSHSHANFQMSVHKTVKSHSGQAGRLAQHPVLLVHRHVLVLLHKIVLVLVLHAQQLSRHKNAILKHVQHTVKCHNGLPGAHAVSHVVVVVVVPVLVQSPNILPTMAMNAQL
jgi:hypothetical protein